MGFQREIDHWFSFGDSCVAVKEVIPVIQDGPTQPTSTLFFLHGRFGHSGDWSPLINQFSSRFRCLCLDFPGFGRSSVVGDHPFSLLEHASLVHSLIEKFTQKNEKIIIVGHDVGGGVAQICALKKPHKFCGLVLINAHGISWKLSKISTAFSGYFALRKLNKLLDRAATLEPEFRELLTSSWKSSASRGAIARSMQAFADSWPWHYEMQTWKKAIQDLSLPVLLLWGKNDSLNPAEAGIDIATKMPDASFYLHENSGHWPHIEQPAWVSSKIKEFVFRTGYGSLVKGAQKSLLR